MKRLSDRAYYAVRAASARDNARQARDLAIAAIHADLAARYDRLAALPEERSNKTVRLRDLT